MDAPAKQPPGWYPDPWAPGAMRWWDGDRWAANAPVAPYRAPETEGLAVASLITAVVGIPVVSIVFGVMARNRIRESGGMKTGDGLAVAGIIVGAITLALIVLALLAFVAAAGFAA